MTRALQVFFAAVIILVGVSNSKGVEEAAYTVIRQDEKFEIREYAPQIVAETFVEGSLQDAGSKAFDRLFGYISGANRSKTKLPMTAPVSQEPSKEKIEMTAPVGQQKVGDKWAVSFMMPASYSMQTLPEPEDEQVRLRQIPARRLAAVRYSGFWSEKNYQRYLQELLSWIEKEQLRITGDPIWARYNSPFTLWFLRRNEILIPIDGQEESQRGEQR